MDEVVRTIGLPGTADEVWAGLVAPEALAAWFGASVDGPLEEGARVTFTWPDGAARGAVVEVAEPARMLRFRWAPFARDAGGRARQVPPTRVTITLDERGDSVEVTVAERLGTSERARAAS